MIFQNYNVRFNLLNGAFASYQKGPALPDSVFQLHYGQYMDYNNMEIFFTDMATRNQDATDIIHKNVKRTRKTFSTLKIDECEIAALAGIMLWNEAAQILPNWLPGEKAKEQIFQELHGYLINKYGNVNIGIRIGSLITTLHELSNAARAISEHRTMEKLFNPGVIDLLMDELPNG
jgi:hypothetical protein